MFSNRIVGRLEEPLTGRCWTPGDILTEVCGRATALRLLGLEPGDRVLFMHGNTLEFFADLLAVWSLGGCAVPIDTRLTSFEIETLADSARPRIALVRGDHGTDAAGVLRDRGIRVLDSAGISHERALSLPGDHPRLDHDALILFTSGTTGAPKGVVHTHRSLRARWASLAQALGLGAFRRTLCLLPTHFGHGLICNCLFPWLNGCDLFVLPPFQPDLVMRLGNLIDRHGVTFLSSVPSVWRLATKLAAPPGKESLERVFCGSAPLSAHLWRRVQEWTGVDQVWNSYGITETGSWLAGTSVAGFEPEDGLVGEAWGGTIKILESATTETPPALTAECEPGQPGYVWVQTPALMRGYFGRDDLTRSVVSQGWFSTGDIGAVDKRGWLSLRGRVREEINKGGTKVYPADIDAVAERFEHVTDVCAFAIDDPHYGQNVALAVVTERSDDGTLRALHDWLCRHLADYQRPVRWFLVDAIPRTSRGKINRDHVATACSQQTPVDLRRLLGSG